MFSKINFVICLARSISTPPPPLHSTRFIRYWSFCDLHVALANFAQLFNCPYFADFCKIIVTLPSMQLPSLIAPGSLASCNLNVLQVDSCTSKCVVDIFSLSSHCYQDSVYYLLPSCLHAFLHLEATSMFNLPAAR